MHRKVEMSQQNNFGSNMSGNQVSGFWWFLVGLTIDADARAGRAYSVETGNLQKPETRLGVSVSSRY
jgi:hypothetical protein